jgi:hypothetical protein
MTNKSYKEPVVSSIHPDSIVKDGYLLNSDNIRIEKCIQLVYLFDVVKCDVCAYEPVGYYPCHMN